MDKTAMQLYTLNKNDKSKTQIAENRGKKNQIFPEGSWMISFTEY